MRGISEIRLRFIARTDDEVHSEEVVMLRGHLNKCSDWTERNQFINPGQSVGLLFGSLAVIGKLLTLHS